MASLWKCIAETPKAVPQESKIRKFSADCSSKLKIFWKNSQKSGMFFDPEKQHAIHHDLPCNPPQLHHDLPPQNTPKSAKPPVKTTSIPLPTFFGVQTAN
jgi:hypothetical protein